MQEYINGKVLINGKLIKQNFLIKDKKIYFKYKSTENPKNIKGMVVSPGFVDMHVHTRVPGYEHKEDINHITQAALAGGFTTMVAMANVNPQPVDYDSLKYIQKKVEQSNINIIQTGRVTNNNEIANINEMSKIVNIFTDDGSPIKENGLMKQALKEIKKNNGLILLHEEDSSLKGHGYHSQFTASNNISSFGSDYELNIVRRDIEINRNINAAIHLQHISCKETVKLIDDNKYKMDITAEVTPHHLFFSSESIDGSTNFKMNPPLNSFEDMMALRKAFKKGIINIISTDHAPHSKSDKDKKWESAANGIIGLETAFASVNTIMGKHLVKILMALSINPAKRIGLDVSIKNGQLANIVIIDPKEEWVFKEDDIKSKSQNSPWINMRLKGKVKEVIWTKR